MLEAALEFFNVLDSTGVRMQNQTSISALF